MSNKKWRTPAGGEASPPETSTGQAETPPAPRSVPVPAESYPDDYMRVGRHSEVPLKPGCYRTTIGVGTEAIDLRLQCCGVYSERPMTNAEVASAASDAVRFLRQVMSITSRVLETLQLGDVRRIVAHDIAMPGDIVLQDGTVSRHADVFEVGADGVELEGRKKSAANQQQAAARKPRGGTHPFLALLKLAIQAAKLIKQITVGTHPKAYNKLDLNTAEHLRAMEDTEKWAAAVLKGS